MMRLSCRSQSLRLLRASLPLALGLGLTACASIDTDSNPQAPAENPTPTVAPSAGAAPILPGEPKLYVLPDENRAITRIVVDTDMQQARFYDGSEEIGWTTVATGVSSYPTPTGEFRVIEKVENKRSNLYGKVYGKGGKLVNANARVGRDPIPDGGRFEGARMPYFLRLTNDGIGLHAGPIPRPGRPASHGCIRVPAKVAPRMFEQIALGTAVSIEGVGPSYERYLAQQRAAAARRAAERRRQEELAKVEATAPEAPSSEPALASAASESQSTASSPSGSDGPAASQPETTPDTETPSSRLSSPELPPAEPDPDAPPPVESPLTGAASVPEHNESVPAPGPSLDQPSLAAPLSGTSEPPEPAAEPFDSAPDIPATGLNAEVRAE
ncbi:MAG: L,D-transpeptidase family protein [Chromatiaceae bacterium]|nr:L,D-transpeptidase family protein [Chromatiaceae bacterium]